MCVLDDELFDDGYENLDEIICFIVIGLDYCSCGCSLTGDRLADHSI